MSLQKGKRQHPVKLEAKEVAEVLMWSLWNVLTEK